MNSLALLKRELLITPRQRSLLLQLSESYREWGHLEASSRCLMLLLQDEPGDPETLYWLSQLGALTRESEAGLQLQRWFAEGLPSNPDQQSYLLYAQAHLHEKEQRWHDAFDLYNQANAARKRALGLLNTDVVLYVEQAGLMQHLDEMLHDELVGVQSGHSAMASHLAGHADTGDDLIFVVGLPRCGSTLVETMLAQGDAVVPLGELGTLPQAVRDSHLLEVLRGDRAEPSQLSQHLDLFRCSYRRDVPAAEGRQIDKTLINFLYVGLILLAWPAATVVHVFRQPPDQMLSAWKARFREGHHYSLELGALVQLQIAYQRLMRYWHARYPDRLFLCEYETLIDYPKDMTEALSRFCGITWSERMLQPQHSRRQVRTASFQQVRQPIHSQSVSGWRRYEAQFQPYCAQLEAAGVSLDGW
jgi:hypothetical protein